MANEETLDFGITSSDEINGASLEDWLNDNVQATKVDPKPKEPTPETISNTVLAPIIESEVEDNGPLNDFLGEEKPKDTPSVLEEDAPKSEDIDPKIKAQTLAKDFFKLGIFTKYDESENEEEIDSEEALLERFMLEKKRGANEQLVNFLRQKGDKYLQAFDAIFVKGIAPEDYYGIQVTSDSILSLDPEQESNQEKIVNHYYRNILGYSQERSDKLIDALKKSGELESEVSYARNHIITSKEREEERLAEIEIQKQRQREQYINVFNNKVSERISANLRNKELNGIPLTEKTANSAIDKLTTRNYQLPNGELISEFDNFLLSLKNPDNIDIALMIQLLRERNWDFSFIQKKAISDKSNSLFTNLVTADIQKKRESPVEKKDNFIF